MMEADVDSVFFLSKIFQ